MHFFVRIASELSKETDLKKVCIFTSTYREAHHTFVNFHIDNLFAGNVSICCQEEDGNEFVDRPILVRSKIETQPWHRAQVKLAHLGRKRRRLPLRGIYGSERAEIVKFLHSQGIDTVLCEFGCIGSEVAEGISDTGIPIFTYFRGYDATARLKSAKERRLLAAAVPKLSGAIFVSKFLRENLAQHGIEHPNSHVIPSGVNTDIFFPKKKSKGTYIAVGSLIEKKRPDITVESFCIAAKSHPEASLTMLGGGNMLEKCQEISHKYDMQNQVHFLGEQPHEVVMKHLQEAEFFLQHSVAGVNGDSEGAPTSIQEALACGCIVLSTRHAGIPELVQEGRTGYLVNELDQPEYCRLIEATLRGELDLKRISRQSREHAVQNLHNGALIKRLEVVLSRAM
jgi:glycosyltransferase involved in cell wall biosynthesis